MYLNFNDVKSLIYETEFKVDVSRDINSNINRFINRPSAIIIQDSYNNPFFPIRPLPRIDTAKMELLKIFDRYKELYGRSSSLLLPWHFCVELVEDRYIIFNTRPLDMKFPLKTKEITKLVDWDGNMIRLMNSPFDIDNTIHVCVIGDSNRDVYTNEIYELMGLSCIKSILRIYKLPPLINERIFFVNLGHRFKLDNVIKFIN